MPEPERSNGMGLSFMGAHLTASGNLTVVMICVLAIVGTILFSGWRAEQIASKAAASAASEIIAFRRDQVAQHNVITRNQDIQICMAQLTPDERLNLRRNFSNRTLEVLCPWISSPPPQVNFERSSP